MGEQTARLREFFSADRWEQSIDRFPLSGFALVEKVNALSPRLVVDVGCGFNPFKGKIPNLVGIDLANRNADIVCDIEDAPFKSASVDVALALGSINFGTRVDVVRQLTAVAGWLRPSGWLFMRANPGEPVGAGIVVFPWNVLFAHDAGRDVGLVVQGDLHEERLELSNGTPATRLFWIYRKQPSLTCFEA